MYSRHNKRQLFVILPEFFIARNYVVWQKLVTSLLNTSAHLRLQNIAKLHIPWALPRQITACPFHRTCLVITLQYHKHLDDTDIQLFAVWRNAGLANPTQGIIWTWSNFFKQLVKISQIYVQISTRNHCLWSFSRVDWFVEHSRAVFIHVSLFQRRVKNFTRPQ